MTQVGIYGVGAYLPEQVRTNDWWPESLVAEWREHFAKTPPDDPATAPTEAIRRTMIAMNQIHDDPFKGAVERRILPDDMLASDMEVAAARQAIDRAGIDLASIDFLLTYTMVPDFLNAPNACLVHKRLELPEKCFSLSVEGVCNSFLLQLALAEQMIAGGRARYGLLIQSCTITRLIPREAHFSPWFGDGATAAVVGAVPAGLGILGRAHHTDGTRHRALVCGIPERRWHDNGPVVAYSADRRAAYEMLLAVTDRGKQAMDEALGEAKLRPDQIDFYGCHQATRWMRRVSQEHLGLNRAKGVDTFAWAGSLSAANVPLALAIGERDGLLHSGDLVGMFSGGTGETWSATVMRWGSS